VRAAALNIHVPRAVLVAAAIVLFAIFVFAHHVFILIGGVLFLILCVYLLIDAHR
jgi:hypothetical protein